MQLFKKFQGKEVSISGTVEGIESSKVIVHKLGLDDGSVGLGLNIISKGIFSYSSTPVSLDEEQARELVNKIKETFGV